MTEEEQKSLFYLRPLTTADRNWVAHFLDAHWGSTKVVSRGQVYYAHLLPGFAAFEGEQPESAEGKESGKETKETKEGKAVGLVTFRIENGECEIMTLDSIQQNIGIGTALVETVKAVAQEEKLSRIWLIITNDNLNALKFYQKRGFSLVAVYPDSLAESRKLKPQIPLIGLHDIPLRDEIELELKL